jgi:CheY-like chemotaxis protein
VGLSLVKHLVELHGGTITAQSGGPGRGSRFTVALPRQRIEFMAPTGSAAGPGEMPATDAPTLDRTASLEGVNVLVVDDQEDARVLLTRALTEFGARVTAVSSGMEALSMLRNSPSGARFDALILDIAMPGEDGYAVLKKVRALELDERVAERMPAIALTAFAGSEDKTRALQAGFQIHVAKPVEPAELAGVINSLVNRRMRGRGRGHRA